MRRILLITALCLPGCMLPYATPSVSYVPPFDLEWPAGEVHVFRVNITSERTDAIYEQDERCELKEIGADGRICDLIDSQLNAIEAGCGQLAGLDPRAALSQAFDLIKSSLDQFAESATADQHHGGAQEQQPRACDRQRQLPVAEEGVDDRVGECGRTDQHHGH